jgi:hypothetical protein
MSSELSYTVSHTQCADTGGAVRTNSGIPAEPATPGHSTGQAQASGGEGAEATCCPLLCINDEELRLLAVQVL